MTFLLHVKNAVQWHIVDVEKEAFINYGAHRKLSTELYINYPNIGSSLTTKPQ